MLIRQLEYFVAVADRRHFGRAADACYVSQPALSTAIGKLERELNITLINRGQNFVGLTVEGERFVVWAKQLLASHDRLKTGAAALRSGISGTLHLGVGPTVSATSIAQLVAAFCASHPGAKVKLQSGVASTELLRQLRNGELDAAIAHFEPEDNGDLTIAPLYKERYVLVAGEKLRPSTPTITWSQAAELPLALLTSDMGSRKLIDEAFVTGGAAVDPQIETDSIAALYAHVATGEWASVVPYAWWGAIPANTMAKVIRIVNPVATSQISLAVDAGDTGSVSGKAFLDVLSNRQSGEVFDHEHRDLLAELAGC